MNSRTKDVTAAGEARKTVLVTGGAGYIGSVLVRRLLRAGYCVRVLDTLLFGRGSLRGVESCAAFELIEGDCRDRVTITDAVSDARAVVHLASVVGDAACNQDPERAREVNVRATEALVAAAQQAGVECFVLASTCSVYGTQREQADETFPCSPLSFYAETKLESEAAVLTAEGGSFHPVVLRFATVFGHSFRPRFDLLVNLLAAQACTEGKITIFNPEQWRPFLHVQDAAAAIVAVLETQPEEMSGHIFNTGDDRMNFRLAEVADAVLEQSPRAEVRHVFNSDARSYRVSFRKIAGKLGFRAEMRLAQGIAEVQSAVMAGRVKRYSDPVHHNHQVSAESGSSPRERYRKALVAFG